MPKRKPYEFPIESFRVLPLNKFTRYGDTELTAEMSDFGPARAGTPWLQRFYNDACDVGIVIYSPTTEARRRFVLSKEVRDAEGDLQAFVFTPLDHAGWVEKVTIFND